MNSDIKNRISFIKAIQLQLSVIIVNFNVKYFLEQCLCSVINATENIVAEILVVDNQSSDGSKEYLSARFKDISFTWCGENGGFSKANNLALKKARGQYILFLNPDTILPEDCLEKRIAFLDANQKVGALGIRMIDGGGMYLKESKRAFPSPTTAFFKLSGLTALLPNSSIFARYYLGHLDPCKNQEVDVLAGAFMMIKKEVLDITGGFDERFFMYGEDVDLSFRIQQAGFKNICFAESTIIHFKGESTQKGNLNYLRLFYGAMALFVEKHYNSRMAAFYKIFIQSAIGFKSLASSIAGSKKKRLKTTQLPPTDQRCLVVASENEFVYIHSIFEQHQKQKNIVCRIDPGVLDTVDIRENISHLQTLIQQTGASAIVFTNSDLKVKKIISLMELLQGDILFLFHFRGSNSIVGSSDKESSGVTMPATADIAIVK